MLIWLRNSLDCWITSSSFCSTEFLNQINIVPGDAQEGAKVGLGVNRPIASRTLTNSATGVKRKPIDPTDTGDRGRYFCAQTNSDTAIS
ncbi:P2 family phage major capsid protein, partial [Salmonella enterica]|uniref:P2 family phage major capsid protein n=1 Tax=Salmonella enterica TaxID=28901 RepID=UPI0020C51838